MTINKLHIIDWYDDIITSIVSFEKDMYLFHCIHKTLELMRKRIIA
jgi:hypothetical protein